MEHTTILYWAIVSFLGVGGAYLCYGLLVRLPALRDLRTRIGALRDRLDLMVCAGKLSESDPAVKVMRNRCERSFRVLHKLDVTHLLLAQTYENRSIDAGVEEERKLLKLADDDVQKLSADLDNLVLSALAINSPALVMVCALGIGVFAVFIGANRLWSELSARTWNATYLQTCPA